MDTPKKYDRGFCEKCGVGRSGLYYKTEGYYHFYHCSEEDINGDTHSFAILTEEGNRVAENEKTKEAEELRLKKAREEELKAKEEAEAIKAKEAQRLMKNATTALKLGTAAIVIKEGVDIVKNHVPHHPDTGGTGHTGHVPTHDGGGHDHIIHSIFKAITDFLHQHTHHS